MEMDYVKCHKLINMLKDFYKEKESIVVRYNDKHFCGFGTIRYVDYSSGVVSIDLMEQGETTPIVDNKVLYSIVIENPKEQLFSVSTYMSVIVIKTQEECKPQYYKLEEYRTTSNIVYCEKKDELEIMKTLCGSKCKKFDANDYRKSQGSAEIECDDHMYVSQNGYIYRIDGHTLDCNEHEIPNTYTVTTVGYVGKN